MLAMSWQKEVDGILARREAAKEHGGAEAVATQHERGKLTIRERVSGLLDPASFQEEGPIAGHSETDDAGNLVSFSAANYVLGFGKIDGRSVVVGGEDFTQRGGSPSPAGFRKSVWAEELANQYRVPLIRFLEGGGGSVPRPAPAPPPGQQGGAAPRPAPAAGGSINAPPRFMSVMQAMAEVPVVSAAMGAVAGLPAARLVASHLSIMTRETSQVLVGGPKLVERALGVDMTKEELGGPKVHLKSGVVDNVADDEKAVFEMIRRFLGYLPTNVWEPAPVQSCDDDPGRQAQELIEIVPRNRRQAYKMRRIVEAVVDEASFFELRTGYGRTQITGLARMIGQPVGVLANDPYFYAGSMTAEGAQKLRRFIELCDTFHLPIVSFVDEPGFMIGPDAEQSATIRYGTEAIFALMQCTVPWISIIVRKVFGVAGGAHFGPQGRVLAWPSAESGALPIEGGVAVAFRRELAEAEDPEALRQQLEDRIYAQRSVYGRAEGFGVHDMIDPRETRPRICEWIEWIQPQLAQHRGPRAYTVRP
jgi:acetyl-CoA carboxylase carboxyltransferase component